MFVEFEVRQVYGADTFYPSNEPAKIFAEIAGTKTLTPALIMKIQRLGIETREVYVPKFKPDDSVVTPGHGGKTW